MAAFEDVDVDPPEAVVADESLVVDEPDEAVSLDDPLLLPDPDREELGVGVAIDAVPRQ